MSLDFSISTHGASEPGVGLLRIMADDRCLTQGLVAGQDGQPIYREGPLIDPKPLAYWLVWNWWRLNWEPYPSGQSGHDEWDLAHSMLAVGEGWLWPRITIHSDGVFTYLESKPSSDDEHPMIFRYLADKVVQVPRPDFVAEVDRFVRELLDSTEGKGSDLSVLWEDLSREREDRELSRFRKFEALLGADPDDLDSDDLISRQREISELGRTAAEEIALGSDGVDHLISASEIRSLTQEKGFDVRIEDGIAGDSDLPMEGVNTEGFEGGDSGAHAFTTPAWKVGSDLAKEVRSAADLNGDRVEDRKLAELLGTTPSAISSQKLTDRFSWILGNKGGRKLALRSRSKTGRRFDAARLLGDSLQFSMRGEALLPATRSYSYRQKMQRAFAAEFLSPWHSVDDRLRGDYSPESLERVANGFSVSSWVIDNHLMNHGIESPLGRPPRW